MLGSSFDSAAYAARFGLAYSHAHFIAPQPAVEALQHYRRLFAPEHLTAPYSSVGVFVIVAEDPQKADLFRRLRELARMRRDRGQRGPAPTLDEAAAHPFTDEELESMHSKRSRQIVGTPEQVAAQVRRYREIGITQFAINTAQPGRPAESRRRSMERFAREVIPLV